MRLCDVVVPALLGLALAACGGQAAASASAKPTASAAAPAASGEAVKLKIGYASASAGFWTVYVAKEGAYFAKHGVDASLSMLASNLMVPALLSGEMDSVDLAAGGVVPAVLAGADLKMIVSDTTPTLQALAATQDIQKIQDFKGKVVVYSGKGSSDDFLMHRLFRMNGMDLDKDVSLLNSGSATNTLAMLEAKRGVGGMMTPPTVFKAEADGMHILMRPSELFPYQGSGLIFMNQRLSSPDGAELARRVVPAMVEAVQRLHADKPFAIQVLKKYTEGVSDDIASKTWDFAVPSAPSDGRPTKEGLQFVLDDLKDTYPGKTLPTADSLLDMRFLDQSQPK